MTYTYVSPEDKGYQLIKVSSKRHFEFFPEDKKGLFAPALKVEYYYAEDNDALIIQRFTANWIKVPIIIIGLIPEVLMYGAPEAYKNIKSLIFERSKGHFVEHRFFKVKYHKPELYEFIKENTVANIYV